MISLEAPQNVFFPLRELNTISFTSVLEMFLPNHLIAVKTIEKEFSHFEWTKLNTQTNILSCI